MKLTDEEFELLKAGMLKILKEIFQTEQKVDPEAWREECLKKQAAGVRFEFLPSYSTVWEEGDGWSFLESKERYREVPQEVSASECQKALEHLAKIYSASNSGSTQLNPPTPHAVERALWKAQREAGTNEVWQQDSAVIPNAWLDFPIDIEPAWRPDCKYRVKPMKLTALIARKGTEFLSSHRAHTWELFGTREEYRGDIEEREVLSE